MNLTVNIFNFGTDLTVCEQLQNAQLAALNGLSPERVIVTKLSEDENKGWDCLSSVCKANFHFQAA